MCTIVSVDGVCAMTGIREIGHVLDVDNDGFFVNSCNAAYIEPPWRAVVDDIIGESKRRLGDKLLSVYVRGSLARGTAVKGVSDIDTFIVVKGNRWDLDLAWMEEAKLTLDEAYSFHGGVEIQCVSDMEILDGLVGDSVRFTIKTLSACVYGEDVSMLIPAYKPGPYLAEDLHYFKQSLDEVCTALGNRKLDNSQVKDICRWIMKTFLRSGLYLVLDREKIYSRDLYPCYVAFSKHYPQYKNDMKRAFSMVINPIEDVDQLLSFCRDFGATLHGEIVTLFPQWQ